jgi:hypothetical protein
MNYSNPVSALGNALTSMSAGVSSLIATTATQKANFTNTDSDSSLSTTIIVVLIICLIISILLLIATYKLTGSALQTILCLLFGAFYLVFAFIYYGFSGYKLVKK